MGIHIFLCMVYPFNGWFDGVNITIIIAYVCGNSSLCFCAHSRECKKFKIQGTFLLPRVSYLYGRENHGDMSEEPSRISCKEEKSKMKKNLVVVSVLALALILSPLSGIGRGVLADEEDTSVAVLSVSGDQSSDSSASAAPTQAPTSTPLPHDAPVEQIVERLNEVLDNAAATDPDGNPNAVVWQLLGVIVQHRMADAMTESVEVREKMADLETRYIEWYNIQVQEMDSTTSTGMLSGTISFTLPDFFRVWAATWVAFSAPGGAA